MDEAELVHALLEGAAHHIAVEANHRLDVPASDYNVVQVDNFHSSIFPIFCLRS
jgi:hypothetical protein